MERYPYKEVYFNEYCSKCKFYDRAEYLYPCCDCLNECVNLYSHKPIRFEESTKKTIKTEEAKG